MEQRSPGGKQGRGTIPAVAFAVAVLVMAAAVPAAEVSISLTPGKIVPGGIMVVSVPGAAGSAEGTFRGKPVRFYQAKSGRKAVVGIDLNTEPGDYPLTVTASGRTVTRTVTIVKKNYPVQKLTLPDTMVTLSPENEARTEREQKRTSAIWPVESMRLWQGRFKDPLPGKKIGTPFGVRRVINGIAKNPHSGVDVTADEGEPVHAPNDGVVVLVDDQFFSGRSVIIDHGQGIYTMFFHLSASKVKQGQAVTKNDVIALVGSTGRSTGPHLHWGVRMQGAKVDPLALLKLKLD